MMSSKSRPMVGKSKVRAPKKHSTGEDLTTTLGKLETAIEQIQNRNASKLSFEEHYRYGYNLVLHKQGHTLYNSVANLIARHLESQTIDRIVPNYPPSLDQTSSSGGNLAAASAGTIFLDAIKDVWEDHMACMSKLRDVFKYMDKVYTGTSSLPTVWDLGLSLFFHHVLLYSTSNKGKQPATATPIRPSNLNARSQPAKPSAVTDPTTVAYQLFHTLLTVIRVERQGEVVSRHSIHDVVHILCELTDEGPVPLPVLASNGTGSGTPVLSGGSSSIANAGRGGPVLGDRDLPHGQSPYRTAWEQAFLKQSSEFYKEESARLLVENDCPTFLQKISKRLEEERERAQTYLSPSTEPLLISLLEKTLITTHIASILDHPASGLSNLIHDNRVDDLKLLYTLFGRVPEGHPSLQTSVSKWIVDVGKQVNDGLNIIVDSTATAEEEEMGGDKKGKAKETAASGQAKSKAALNWVQNVLELKDKFDGILVNAFSADKNFEKSINDAFSVFVNINDRSPEYISLYIDENLKKGLKGKTETEVDDVLLKTIALFRYLNEKDRFEKYYNNHLSKRLIGSKSVSDDAERNMLAKFKIEAGHAFSKSAEGMMKDVKISEDTLVEYKRFSAGQIEAPPFSLEPIICGSNFWPFTQRDHACKLPEVLMSGIEHFEKFYHKKHSGRKLSFRPEFGTVDVKTRFKARSHELTVSTQAMCILALFEGLGEDERLPYTDISESTNMVSAELKRHMQSLAMGKFRILNKHPKGREVNETDEFSFNSAFTSPLAKIRIQTIISKVESAEERRETDVKVEEARNTLCDACIVRIMKDRKSLQHTELVQEVVKQLSSRFNPEPKMIKQSIERLIEKEYLERNADDRRLLHYMA